MAPLPTQIPPAVRFERLLSRACPTCGSAWCEHSLVIVEGSGHGLLLCAAGDLFCVNYPEGDVTRIQPVRSEPVTVEVAAPPPACVICGGETRRRVCAPCTVAGFAVIDVAGYPKLLLGGRPVPYSPHVRFAGELPRHRARKETS